MPGTVQAYADAVDSGAEYAELDIRRAGDGTLVAYHNRRVRRVGPAVADLTHARLNRETGYEVPTVAEVMSVIGDRLMGHLDVKEVGYERQIIELAMAAFGPDRFVVTTYEEPSLAAIARDFPTVRTVMTFKRVRSPLLAGPWPQPLLPLHRIAGCGARGVALHRRLATAPILRQCSEHGLFTMVWTVNDDRPMSRYLADERVDVLITDRIRRAVGIRDGTG